MKGEQLVIIFFENWPAIGTFILIRVVELDVSYNYLNGIRYGSLTQLQKIDIGHNADFDIFNISMMLRNWIQIN